MQRCTLGGQAASLSGQDGGGWHGGGHGGGGQGGCELEAFW